jgi:hypothetical protein
MGLAFLVPAFLAGLAALAIPVVLHLRHRERDRPVRFPSLMFLERLPIRTARRQRITDWPLLLLRVAAFALLALAFARPFAGGAAAVAAAERVRAVVLLLDRSLSMSHRDVWPAALDSARAVVTELGPRDRVAVVLFDDAAEVVQPLTTDRAAARAAVDGARPTARATRYVAALRAARQVLAGAPDVAGEIVVVTDLQRTGTAGLAGLELPVGLTVRAVTVAAPSRANAAVAGVDVQRLHDAARPRLAIQARVATRELAAPRRAHLTLTLNGRSSGSRDVTLPAGGSLPVAFDPVPLPAGRIRGTVTLDSDALGADDVLHFTVAADDELRVLLVAPEDAWGDETLFFTRALAIGRAPAIRLERRRPTTLTATALHGTALVVLWDTPPPGGVSGDVLAAWVRGGGGLVLVAGRRLAARAPSAATPLVPATLRGSTDRLADRGGALGEVSLEHPLFTPFRDAGAALGAPRFLRYPRVEPGPETETLARFDDGLPAVVERRLDGGRVVLIATPLDARAGDFPLQPAYLPFLRRLVIHASGHEAAPLWQFTGETWRAPPRERLPEPVIATPAGAIIRPTVPEGGIAGGRGGGGPAVALDEAGFYAAYQGRVAGEPLAVVAVNAPPGESDLTPVDPRELLLGVRQSDSTAAAASGEGPPTAVEVERRQRLWRVLLVLAAVALLAETLVSNRGWRGTAGRIAVAPSERSAS